MFAIIGRETIMLILRVAVVSGVCILGVSVVRTQTTADTVALAGVNVIDVESGDVRRNQTIVVSAGSGRIVEIVSGRATKPQHSRIIDGAGKFVIPGLWDMHVHAFNDGRHDYVLPLLLANGITGVRDMGTNLTLEDVQQVIQDVVDGRRPTVREAAPTRHPRAAPEFLRQHLPGNAAAEDKQNAGETRAIQDARPSAFRPTRWSWQERFNKIPQRIGKQCRGHTRSRYFADKDQVSAVLLHALSHSEPTKGIHNDNRGTRARHFGSLDARTNNAVAVAISD
jgi:hypothetical protein